MKTLKYAWRFLIRSKSYTIINVIGLALSLACTIILVRYIHRELQVNTHCTHAERTFIPLREVEIKKLPDDKQDFMRSIQMMQGAMMILAIVSILLVVLSIYSAISMDTISRQKEMAIRKINGATPTTIATVFGKAYLTIFLLAFAVAYPLLRLAMMAIIDNMKVVSEWWWGVVLFFSVAFMIFLTTAYKIYRIMHINPAEIIKNE
ncbi:ABC transporter permease [Bacteroides cellulosilyticus]|uniref:ABC transporter permease n=1 Tax=Bacteroides cellulosilyticus TaxID=246787 RepID=UPI002938FAB1|nr:FtsX-like permease family protein [Bacteroides cellulosilyticus]